MKRGRIVTICIAICLIFGLACAPVNHLEVWAAEAIATVQGTVMSGTTAELLLLSTKGGKMEIKLDSGTDTSACKLLLPDKKIAVSVSHGSDGYLHAIKITSDVPTTASPADPATTATVSGTIGEKTTDSVIFFQTAQGEMEIKLDATTNLSGCSVLVMGKTYYITCARGSDAYMHAISISDTAAGAAAPGAANTPNAPNAATGSVTGTVADNTKENLLYLSTKGGEMQFVIDGNADTSKGMVLTPGNSLTVSYYHGSDAYLHAVCIAGVKDGKAANTEIDTANQLTVTGTVGSDSTENMLYLNTKQGKMELKLDAVSGLNNCKVLVSGKKVSVTCARGSDAYLHAIAITAV